MQSLKFSASVIVGSFLAVFLIVLAIRKITYELYKWFPTALQNPPPPGR